MEKNTDRYDDDDDEDLGAWIWRNSRMAKGRANEAQATTEEVSPAVLAKKKKSEIESSDDGPTTKKRRKSRRIEALAKTSAVATKKERTPPVRAAAAAARTKVMAVKKIDDQAKKSTASKIRSHKRGNKQAQDQRSYRRHSKESGGASHSYLALLDERWNGYLEELRTYKKIHGHTNVPAHKGSLSNWVSHQRTHYRSRIQGKEKKGPMTDERVKALNDIGFVWDRLRECGGTERDTSLLDEKWNGCLEDLRSYKKTHGHTNVPARQGSLGIWVCSQRHYYRAKHQGKKTTRRGSLSDERERALDELGFAWASPSGPYAVKKDSL